jgi:hypothetical protein
VVSEIDLSKIFSIATSRLGIGYDDWLRMTPRELHDALEDKDIYYFKHQKDLLYLTRYIGLIIRNKSLARKDQLLNLNKFYRFWFDKPVKVDVPTQADWKALDKKYIRAAKK